MNIMRAIYYIILDSIISVLCNFTIYYIYIYIHTNPSYPSPFVPYPLRAGGAKLLVVGGQKQLIPTAAATNHAATGSAVMFAFGAAEPGGFHRLLIS